MFKTLLIEHNTYTNEILQSLVVLATIVASRSLDILLKKGNGGSVSNTVSLNNIEVVVSLNLTIR